MLDRSPIEGCLAYLAIEIGHATLTQLATRAVLERFADWLEKQPDIPTWEAIQEDHLQHYLRLQQQTRHLAPASLKLETVFLRSLFRYMTEEKILPHDPAAKLDLPRLPRKLPGMLTEEEVNRLLHADFGESPLALRNRAILDMLYGSGIRVGEISTARIEDLKLDDLTLLVRGKGNKVRLVLLGSKAGASLRSYLQKSRPALVSDKTAGEIFISEHGQRLTTVRLWQIVKEAARLAGITQNVYPHLLRHSFATHMLNHGADLRVIQELLGHSSIGTTEIYTHVDPHRLKNIHSQFHPEG